MPSAFSASTFSIDDNLATTLVHAFVASRVDYCGSWCAKEDDRQTAACPQCCGQECLQHPQVRSRADTVPATRTSLVGDVVDRVRFRVCVQVYKCLHNMAPGYLLALCQPVSSVPGHRHLRSAGRGELDFPVSICQRMWDGCLPTPLLHPGTRCLTISRTLIFPFKLSNVILRHSSFPHTSTFSVFEVSYKNALYNFTVIIIIIIIITHLLRHHNDCRSCW